MERSRKLVLQDWTQANNALHQYFVGNKSKLADHVSMSRTTVTAFFNQKPVREAEFRKICRALRLNWEAVSEVTASAQQSETRGVQTNSSHTETDLDAIIPQLQEHCRQKILSQHSRMRLLSGEEIGVDQLYVDVWLLNRPPSTYHVSPSKLLETFDLRNDRLGLDDRIKRLEGFEVAEANPKLVILGKPGSGKTTFLKHLAVDWCKGEFQPDLIAVLIEFRQIRDEDWYLLDAIGRKLGLDEGPQIRDLKNQIERLKRLTFKSLKEKQKQQKQINELQFQLNSFSLQVLLKKGSLLILMDGLDEVSKSYIRQDIEKQLLDIEKEYPNNRFILTCRTQIISPIPSNFVPVEVADFNLEQVQKFVENWFVVGGRTRSEALCQWNTVKASIDSIPSLRELTATPVLLSLICVVVQDEGEIPANKNWLYKKGINLLLNRWNDEKQIDGWEVGSEKYRQLSVEEKEELLMLIAAYKFENPENFVLFEQDEIVDKINSLLGLFNKQEAVSVLRSIEAQHGFLIERADELWSFSHLTFQEYFTIQWLTQLPSEELAERIADKRWQKIVKQLLVSQQPNNRLLQIIKWSIDHSVINEPSIILFLKWIFKKAGSLKSNYKAVAVRAVYLSLSLFDLIFDFDLPYDLDSTFYIHFLQPQEDNSELDYDLEFSHYLDSDLGLDFALDRILNRASALDQSFSLKYSSALDSAFAHYFTCNCTPGSELTNQLEQLYNSLPKNSLESWWKTSGFQWVKQIRQVMIEYRNIGHDWQFSEVQEQKLIDYYDLNKFLAELLNIKGAVSDSVRAEIEDTMLLPWDELQRRQPHIYRQLQSSSSSAIKVFMSYSRDDEELREKLEKHLANLKRQGKIQAWHSGAIEAGVEREAAIQQQLESAQIILLLISADFMASDHCYSQQMQQALQRHQAGGARVVPILLRSTDWQGSPFSHLEPLPSNGVPITRWDNQDEAFLNVVEGIRRAIASIS